MNENEKKYSEADLKRAYFMGFSNRNVEIKSYEEDYKTVSKQFPEVVGIIDSIHQKELDRRERVETKE